MASVTEGEGQWAGLERRTLLSPSLVATRSLTFRGMEITAGVTRISHTHPWLSEIRNFFEEVDSPGGREAVRSRAGEPKRRSRSRKSWEL